MGEPNVLIAPDSFKGSATSAEVGELIEEGVRRVAPCAKVTRFAIADGGEGTVEAITSALGGAIREVEVRGPLGANVPARYGVIGSELAVIEVAEACGITLMERTSENALRASSFGVGQLILDAIGAGAKRILVGLGGSATSDGGTGMASALGVRFADADGAAVPSGVAGLERLASIDASGIGGTLEGVELVALSDVTKPLVGEKGALSVYGPQKGVATDDVAKLDGWMARYAGLVAQETGCDVASAPGAGAAGGLGAALMAFCGAKMEPGIECVLNAIGLEEAARSADLVITGEGRMDAQSAFGKAPVGVARRAKRFGLPVIAIVGSRASDLGPVYDSGIDLVIPAICEPVSLDDCMAHVDETLPIAAETAMRAFMLRTR